jgi:hypothetical protein
VVPEYFTKPNLLGLVKDSRTTDSRRGLLVISDQDGNLKTNLENN